MDSKFDCKIDDQKLKLNTFFIAGGQNNEF